MATTNTPTLQKNLNISFALAQDNGPVDFFTFPIKPEELTRTEPSRTSAVNALGGAWVDSFGRGLATLTISGNTGWRARGSGGDGVAQFTKLRDEFIHAWHDLREMKAKAGVDPNEVRLIFIDPLNGNYVADVVPTNFTLRRSRSQPLLLMYNIAMVVTNDKAQVPTAEAVNPLSDPATALESLKKSVSDINEIQKSLRSAIKQVGDFGAQVHKWTDETFGPVMKVASEVIQAAHDAKELIGATGQVVVDLAADLSAVGNQMWSAVSDVTSLPNAVLGEVGRIKSAMSNLKCVLVNGYKAAYRAESYSDWYGASNCSSTLGGQVSPLAGTNPFDGKVQPPIIKVKPSAVAAINSAKAQPQDMAAPVNVAEMSRQLAAISDGVTV